MTGERTGPHTTPAQQPGRWRAALLLAALLTGLPAGSAQTPPGAGSAAAQTRDAQDFPRRDYQGRASNTKASREKISAQEQTALDALYTRLRPATLRIEDCPTPGVAAGSCAEPDGVGTAFLISADGLALTAYHVVEGASNLVAVTADRKRYPLNVVGFDAQNDVALLRVQVPAGTPFFPLAGAAPSVRDPALVIGNGDGRFLRSKTGRLLALDTAAEQADFPSGTLKLTAELIPGDSGGPVINARGEVVGVVSYISVQGSSRRITSYAVPVTSGSALLADLRRGVQRDVPVIGVSLPPALAELSEDEFREVNRQLRLGLGTTAGAFFTTVAPGSPAAQAGLKATRIASNGGAGTPGDVVTAVNGKRIFNFSDFQFAVRAFRPGDTVTLTVVREGAQRTVKLVLVGRQEVRNG